MPVRSLRSSVITWPKRDEVERALRAWAAALAERQEGLLAVGYFGSYATGRYGVGSDLDLVVLLESSDTPPERRVLAWSLEALLVPTEVLVYTRPEWRRLEQQGGRTLKMLKSTTVWVWQREGADLALNG